MPIRASVCGVCARSIGEGDKWRKVIYPGMKQAIISVLQVSQDRVIDRKVLKFIIVYCFIANITQNTFELYGADFMICADYKPWLVRSPISDIFIL